MSSVRLLTLDEAQLRRLEPHLYHLILTSPARPSTALMLDRAVESDAAPEPYSLVVEPLGGLSVSLALSLRHAVYVSIVSRSAVTFGVTRAADAMSQLAGGPAIACYESLEAAYAAAQRAIAHRA